MQKIKNTPDKICNGEYFLHVAIILDNVCTRMFFLFIKITYPTCVNPVYLKVGLVSTDGNMTDCNLDKHFETIQRDFESKMYVNCVLVGLNLTFE